MKQHNGDGRSPEPDLPGVASADLQRRRWLRAFSAAPLVAGMAASPATAAMKTNARFDGYTSCPLIVR